ncbi:unnamed protein product [Brachionus calyciflorus]|uniref:Threonylcarbamoyl-AMP synthase n=1 Tax=Brachionus calyciflorus TaxID=104777 RepID=A0A813SGB0_9BILA|nr:unnamed protein product [Brachionus calyciflorus]
MENKILTVEEALNNLPRIKTVLQAGGVIAVPTDTIYGVACLACNKESLDRIYKIKGRNLSKPLAISVGKSEDLEKWSHVNLDLKSLNALLPGPVTLVFDRKSTLPAELNPNTKSIGIRIPNNKFMIELAQFCNEPIALTSANISNEPSSLSINEFETLWKDLDLIVDGGQLSSGEVAKAGSTVIDLTKEGTYQIIRNGSHYDNVVKILDETCKLTRRF